MVYLRGGWHNQRGTSNAFFGFDSISAAWSNCWLSPPFPSEVIDETDATPITMNSDGLLAEISKDGHETMPHFIKASIATPRQSRTYMETLAPLVERGGYIPFCDHRCPPNVKPEGYLYYLHLKEKMFGMG